MNLREQIGSIAQGLSSSPAFYYGRKSEINIQGDNMTLPAVILIEPDQFGFNLSLSTGAVKDTYNVFIQFVDKVDALEDANYRHPVVESMRSLCAEFLRTLFDSDLFADMNTNIPGVIVVDSYDVNVAGIEINLANLTDLQPRPC